MVAGAGTVRPVGPDAVDAAQLQAAAQRLADGALVAFPTETVYGLGARADDDAAVARIYAAKGRPADHPLIVHLAWDPARGTADALTHFAAAVTPAAQRLIDHCWPGPVTLILPRRAGVAGAAAGGQDSIGLRCPSHPVAQALLRAAAALGVPGVAAPSANRYGRVSPTCAAHVRAEFGPELPLLDGGACAVGIESAIVDVRGAQPVLLRPGQLSRQTLQAVLGCALAEPGADAPRASGTLASHYAPRARVRLLALDEALPALRTAAMPAAGLALYSRQPVPAVAGLHQRTMPDDPDAVAHELFAVLRALDDLGVQEIWVQAPPAGAAWDGVRDRLCRAAA